MCLQAQQAAWTRQLQLGQALNGDGGLHPRCGAAGRNAAEAATEAALAAAAAEEVTSPAKRTCWQAPNARRGRAFVRSLSRTDSSAPGRQEELTDVLVRLGSDDVGAAVSDAFLQEQLQAFGTPCSAGEQQEDSEGLRRMLSGLVEALLEGPGQGLFEEVYLPWLRGASPCRLAAERSTFVCYLGMLRAGMDWRAVQRLMLGYLQGLLLRILRGSEDAGTDAGQQRKRQRRCAAPAAALPSASGATDSSMGQPGSSSAAACCWRDTASSCTSSEASADTQQ